MYRGTQFLSIGKDVYCDIDDVLLDAIEKLPVFADQLLPTSDADVAYEAIGYRTASCGPIKSVRFRLVCLYALNLQSASYITSRTGQAASTILICYFCFSQKRLAAAQATPAYGNRGAAHDQQLEYLARFGECF